MAVVEKRERGEGIEQLGGGTGSRRARGARPEAARAEGDSGRSAGQEDRRAGARDRAVEAARRARGGLGGGPKKLPRSWGPRSRARSDARHGARGGTAAQG